MKDEQASPETESKYIQQHLANERTFLAWIRTAGAIIGIGFIATGYHFETVGWVSGLADGIALLIGGFSIFVGLMAILFSLYSYLRKRKAINQQQFHSTIWLNVFMTVFALILTILYGIYLFIIY